MNTGASPMNSASLRSTRAVRLKICKPSFDTISRNTCRAPRRLRASIELFSGVIYAGQLKICRRDIPWIAGQAGAVRECDVTSALLKDRAAKIDPELADSLEPLLAELDARRKS